VDASPLLDQNTVIAGSRDNSIYVVDKLSGTVLDRLNAGLQLSSPCLTGDNAVLTGLGLPGGGIAAYDIKSPQRNSFVPQWSVSLPQYTYSSPAISGQTAVIGATNGALYGIDISKMDTIWSVPTTGGIYLSTPAIDEGAAYFAPGDADRCVYAVNLLTGAIVWKSETEMPSAVPTGALAKKMSLQSTMTKELAQLPRVNPGQRKQILERLYGQGLTLPLILNTPGLGKKSARTDRKFVALDGIKTSSMAVNAHNVFVAQKQLGYVLINDSLTSDQQEFCLQALDKRTGAQAWSFSDWRSSIHLGYCSSPVATETMVFFGWGQGKLYGLAARTGEMLWSDSVQGDIISSPAISSGKLFVATMDGFVYAYDLSGTASGVNFSKSTYCYPNPASGGVSNIQVYVDKPGILTLQLFTMSEKPMFNQSHALAAGEKYTYVWNLNNVANGVYFAKVSVKYDDGGSDKKTLKIAVLR